MTNIPVRCMLFVSSYFPLSLIFAILLFYSNLVLAITILVIGVAGLVVLWQYIYMAHEKTAFLDEVTELQKRDGEVLSYIASYLVPFATFQLSGWQQGTAIVIFILVLLLVYVNSNMIYINPMLNLRGYHLYEVRIRTSKVPLHLITRYEVELEQPIRYIRLSDGIILGRKV